MRHRTYAMPVAKGVNPWCLHGVGSGGSICR